MVEVVDAGCVEVAVVPVAAGVGVVVVVVVVVAAVGTTISLVSGFLIISGFLSRFGGT